MSKTHVNSFLFLLYKKFIHRFEQTSLVMGKFSIIHFNDVYNVEPTRRIEPIGGATRFITAIKSFQHLNPLVLFSGDAFSPSSRKYLK